MNLPTKRQAVFLTAETAIRHSLGNVMEFYNKQFNNIQLIGYEAPNFLLWAHQFSLTGKVTFSPLEVVSTIFLASGSLCIRDLMNKKYKNPNVALLLAGSLLTTGSVCIGLAGVPSGWAVAFASLETMRGAAAEILEHEKERTKTKPELPELSPLAVKSAYIFHHTYGALLRGILTVWREKQPNWPAALRNNQKSAAFLRKHPKIGKAVDVWEGLHVDIPRFIEERPKLFGPSLKGVLRFADIGAAILHRDILLGACAILWQNADIALTQTDEQFNKQTAKAAKTLKDYQPN